jgi:hypothetical protein
MPTLGSIEIVAEVENCHLRHRGALPPDIFTANPDGGRLNSRPRRI